VIDYIAERLEERSTWSDVIVAVAAAAVLPAPWSYVSIVVGVVKALVPDGPIIPKNPDVTN
jgi:hypothetical protein